MDHAGIEQDRVDLQRYRAGLPPLVYKEYYVKPTTPEKVINEMMATLTKQLKKEKVVKECSHHFMPLKSKPLKDKCSYCGEIKYKNEYNSTAPLIRFWRY